MTFEQLGVSLNRPAAVFLLPLARRPDLDPMVDPLGNRHLVEGDVLAGVTRTEDAAQFLRGLRLRALDGLCVAHAIDPVAESPTPLPALVDAAGAVVAALTHWLPLLLCLPL